MEIKPQRVGHGLTRRDYEEIRQRADEIVALRNEGLTLQAIGEKFGITRERVRQVLNRRKDAPTAKQVQEKKLEQIEGIVVDLYQTGATISSIVESLKITHQNVKKIVTKAGLPLRGKGHSKWDILTERECRICKRVKSIEHFPYKNRLVCSPCHSQYQMARAKVRFQKVQERGYFVCSLCNLEKDAKEVQPLQPTICRVCYNQRQLRYIQKIRENGTKPKARKWVKERRAP